MSEWGEQERPLSEPQLIDDMSCLIQLFRKTVGLCEVVAARVIRGQPVDSQLTRISGHLSELETLGNKYSLRSQPLPVDKITLHRFVSRISETTTMVRSKYQAAQHNHQQQCLLRLVQVAEGLTRNWDSQPQISAMAQTLQVAVMRFCLQVEQTDQLEESPEKDRTLSTLSAMRSKIQGIGSKRSSLEAKQETSSQSWCLRKVEPPKISQSMADLRTRFDVLKGLGLDLDFDNFKSSYFWAKSNSSDFMESYQQRNWSIGRLINSYHESFSLYLRKQQQKIIRKNRRMRTYESYNPHQRNTSCDNVLKNHRKPQPSVDRRGRGLNRTMDRPQTRTNKVESSKDEKAEDVKVSYKMNQVMLTLGNGKVKGKAGSKGRPNIAGALANKKALEAYPLNQPSLLEQPSKRTLLFINSKLQEGANPAPRVKTEAQKPNHSDEWSSEPRDTPKPATRSKYLQVNCLNQGGGRVLVTRAGGVRVGRREWRPVQ